VAWQASGNEAVMRFLSKLFCSHPSPKLHWTPPPAMDMKKCPMPWPNISCIVCSCKLWFESLRITTIEAIENMMWTLNESMCKVGVCWSLGFVMQKLSIQFYLPIGTEAVTPIWSRRKKKMAAILLITLTDSESSNLTLGALSFYPSSKDKWGSWPPILRTSLTSLCVESSL
jgi:hypothetical protein